MIALLRGRVHSVQGKNLTIDVNGVGYEVICSAKCSQTLSIGEEKVVVVHTDVKEDSIRLYGFEDQMEKQLFLLLIKVNGIGARSAIDIVSQIDKADLLRAIGSGDLKRLQSLKGVGRKTADRIILELKDKVAEFTLERQFSSLVVEAEVVEPLNDAIEALQALGFSRKEAERAVQQAEAGGTPKGADSGTIVKEALKYV